jgi:L-seryl-tRNA(Ser) seleniumtransferase
LSTRPATDPPRPRPPSVERVLAELRTAATAIDADPVALTAVVREVIEDERTRLAAGTAPRDPSDLAEDAARRLVAFTRAGIVTVINATGVIVHTNLGRAPWPTSVAAGAADIARDYVLLELDRETGRRGARARVAEDHLVALTGAADAFVTNNNAAAVSLAVALAGRGSGGGRRAAGVVVSRGELVEIGGGVRIPDIVRRAGARLIEVGTTNRTRAADFAPPLEEGRASMVLRVHPSNFTMTGFTETPDPAEVVRVAHEHGAIVVDDLGSGALLDTAEYGLAHEPMPGERLAAGADLVTFSGDKLVGGPQAGLIVGRADLIARIRRDPLARAMRPDKVTMAAVALTLGCYRAGRATTDIPVWRMIATPLPAVRSRAGALAARIGEAATVVELRSTVGGGSLPGETLASAGVALAPRRPGSAAADRLLASLRLGTPIVIGRIEDRAVVLDLRTVEPGRDDELAASVARALAGA